MLSYSLNLSQSENSIYSSTDDTLCIQSAFFILSFRFVSFRSVSEVFVVLFLSHFSKQKCRALCFNAPYKTHELKYETKTISRMLFSFNSFTSLTTAAKSHSIAVLRIEPHADDLVFAFIFNLRNEEKRVLFFFLHILDWRHGTEWIIKQIYLSLNTRLRGGQTKTSHGNNMFFENTVSINSLCWQMNYYLFIIIFLLLSSIE